MPETGPLHGDAATVVILRDGPDGVEVLLLERHGRGSFAGAWAFPGGTVDPEDGLIGAVEGTGAARAGGTANAVGTARADDAGASPHDAPLAVRRAAVRETREETRLRLTEDALVGLSVWVPPQRAEKRLRTWFFVAADPGGDVVLNDGEHVAYAWVTPAVALERHGAGEMVLFPPTWVTLHGLLGAETAALAIADAASRAPELYASLQLFAGDGQIEAVLWAGDAQYGNEAAMGPARHRLQMSSLPWVYERSE
ncbi:NUDIX hydrolase [Sinomonas sp. G460-2]|uniref:NUDIX hydrolase n=1 Tax=Sinomonas sp. G460-2 TaxID=3393464 RepID=UPI0039EF8485